MRLFRLLGLFPALLLGQDLTGVIDLHTHSDPDSMARSIDAIDLARLAKANGMRGLILKNHFESTSSTAYLVRKEVPGIEVFGGISLDLEVGGINPRAVEHMADVKGGWGRIVWMPTNDAEHHVHFYDQQRPFVPVVRNGQVLPEVEEVLKIIARRDLIFATGHSSPGESLILIREAKRLGVKRMVVTHAMVPFIGMTVPQMIQAAEMGAYIEFVATAIMSPNPDEEIKKYAAAIHAVGPAHCVLSSDFGRADYPLHTDGLRSFFRRLAQEGVTESEIHEMSRVNPARVLGLDPEH